MKAATISSVKAVTDRITVAQEHDAQHHAALERMAVQKAARLLGAKNRAARLLRAENRAVRLLREKCGFEAQN